jgi:hypothetical protein
MNQQTRIAGEIRDEEGHGLNVAPPAKDSARVVVSAGAQLPRKVWKVGGSTKQEKFLQFFLKPPPTKKNIQTPHGIYIIMPTWTYVYIDFDLHVHCG